MLNYIREIIKPRYESLNIAHINESFLLENFKILQEKQEKAEIIPVLKSNAYGHGIKEICKILNKSNCKMIAVDSFPELQIAYKYFKKDILVLSEMPVHAYKYCKLQRTEFVVYNTDTIKYLSRYGKKIKLHLFVNTGMNREGIDNFKGFLNDNIEKINKLTINGICSHLAESDNTDSDFNNFQEDNFKEAVSDLRLYKIFPKWIHLGNSSAVFSLKNDLYTAFRPGIYFYGYNNLNENHPGYKEAEKLKPALDIYSKIVSIHRIKAGDRVSYSNSFEALNDTSIATIPFGYYEGLDRRMSNKSYLQIKLDNKYVYAKIAGSVCMNLSCIQFVDNKIDKGQLVRVISNRKEDRNSIKRLANDINTIEYEILSKINHLIKKKIIK